MNADVELTLQPLGRTLPVQRGTPLQDVLFAQGVEFPCGGRGRCKGCRVKLLKGDLLPTPGDQRLLTQAELDAGWRLACQARAVSSLTVELAQWETPILADNSLFEFTPRAGFGIAIDLGTTTIVAQLLDLSNAHILAVQTALNAQALHGADIMSRLDFAVHGQGQSVLTLLIRRQIGQLISELLRQAQIEHSRLASILLVGNTVMHHLFCGLDVTPLAAHPFETERGHLQLLTPQELGWEGAAAIRFLPCLGSFVGSDILAGLLATRLHEGENLMALVDLGTNGEIVVGNRHRMLCASTAAGPAFEGARISMGMRAATGAISQVSRADGRLHCAVIGGGAARGLCGSGLVDAVAAGLDLGWIRPNGRITTGDSIELKAPIFLTQPDVRELQLAKGAIAAGIRLLLQALGATMDDLSRLYLAGAFGNYINLASAQRIGLLGLPADRTIPAGNTALLGAKLALCGPPAEDGAYTSIRQRVRHVSLNEDPAFHEFFVQDMLFHPGLS